MDGVIMISSFLHERIDETACFLVGGGSSCSIGLSSSGSRSWGSAPGTQSAVTLNAEVLVMHLDADKLILPNTCPRVPMIQCSRRSRHPRHNPQLRARGS